MLTLENKRLLCLVFCVKNKLQKKKTKQTKKCTLSPLPPHTHTNGKTNAKIYWKFAQHNLFIQLLRSLVCASYLGYQPSFCFQRVWLGHGWVDAQPSQLLWGCGPEANIRTAVTSWVDSSCKLHGCSWHYHQNCGRLCYCA